MAHTTTRKRQHALSCQISSHSHASEIRARWPKSPMGVPITCACAMAGKTRHGGSECGRCVGVCATSIDSLEPVGVVVA